MPVFASLAIALAQPPLWCPPPRPIVICPPIVWVECPPFAPLPAKVPAKGPAQAPIKPAVPETKPDEPKPKVEPKPDPKPEIKPAPPIKSVTNDTPTSPSALPKLDATPQPPKPAPKIEIELPSIPPAKDTIIPKPVDLPAIPPQLPKSISGYRPTVDVVRFPANTEITNVTLFNLTATETTVTVSGRTVILPARTKQRIDVTGDVWWQLDSVDRRTAERGGEIEIYLNGK